ncbi:MAG: 4Fe-4S dicluster domain-containing protein [bacterium]|nr:4Fe-4S dicluster domain-containing protein [bacterium]
MSDEEAKVTVQEAEKKSQPVLKTLRPENLSVLIQKGLDLGYKVFAPVKDGELVTFEQISGPGEVFLEGITTRMSPKSVFFPRTEKVFSYRIAKEDIALGDQKDFAPPTIILGCRPCDAASLPIMDRLFRWDYQDRFWNERREATLIVSISCLECDEACFCTSVGLAPDSTEGSDILLTLVSRDQYLAEIMTDKGADFVEKTGLFDQAGADLDKAAATKAVRGKLGQRFDLDKIKPWLDENYEHDFWKEVTRMCIGCGICTYVCPTCHCFDLVDEAHYDGGAKNKNWDACQFAQFTVHASGHNPRPDQVSRHRQRIMHKYKYYPDNLGATLCTGCGRCVRHCPMEVNLIRILNGICELSAGELPAEAPESK